MWKHFPYLFTQEHIQSFSNFFLWLSFRTLHLLSFKILFNKPSPNKCISIIYYLNLYLDISQDSDVKRSLMLWSKHSVVIAGGVLPVCAHKTVCPPLLNLFSGLHGGKSQPNDFRPSTKGLFYGLFMFVVFYILEEILEKRVNLDGMTFGTEFCLWRHRRRIKEIKDISYASLLSWWC